MIRRHFEGVARAWSARACLAEALVWLGLLLALAGCGAVVYGVARGLQIAADHIESCPECNGHGS